MYCCHLFQQSMNYKAYCICHELTVLHMLGSYSYFTFFTLLNILGTYITAYAKMLQLLYIFTVLNILGTYITVYIRK